MHKKSNNKTTTQMREKQGFQGGERIRKIMAAFIISVYRDIPENDWSRQPNEKVPGVPDEDIPFDKPQVTCLQRHLGGNHR